MSNNGLCRKCKQPIPVNPINYFNQAAAQAGFCCFGHMISELGIDESYRRLNKIRRKDKEGLALEARAMKVHYE